MKLDEPPVLCGKNLGANPVDYLPRCALWLPNDKSRRSCRCSGESLLKGVESRYEGDLDLRGFLGTYRKRFLWDIRMIRLYFKIEADVSETQKEELIRMAQKYSPVFNSIAKPVTVSVQLDKA